MSDLFKSAGTTAVKAPKRRYLWIIPVVLILIAAAFLLLIDWRTLLPAETVNASRARLSSTTVTAKGKALFQASGWVEANPYLTWASSLISGTVKKVYVS